MMQLFYRLLRGFVSIKRENCCWYWISPQDVPKASRKAQGLEREKRAPGPFFWEFYFRIPNLVISSL